MRAKTRRFRTAIVVGVVLGAAIALTVFALVVTHVIGLAPAGLLLAALGLVLGVGGLVLVLLTRSSRKRGA